MAGAGMVAQRPEAGGGVAVQRNCKRKKKESDKMKRVNEFNKNEDVDSFEWE